MNFNFGIPLKREKKTEKYDFPVLTMQKENNQKHSAKRFILNKSAVELLGITHEADEAISLGFPQQNEGNFVIARTTDNENVPNKHKYLVGKTENSFSNSQVYNAIKKELDLNLTEDVEFRINEDNTLHLLTTISQIEFTTEEDKNQYKLEIC
jgi:hypothetical protein